MPLADYYHFCIFGLFILTVVAYRQCPLDYPTEVLGGKSGVRWFWGLLGRFCCSQITSTSLGFGYPTLTVLARRQCPIDYLRQVFGRKSGGRWSIGFAGEALPFADGYHLSNFGFSAREVDLDGLLGLLETLCSLQISTISLCFCYPF